MITLLIAICSSLAVGCLSLVWPDARGWFVFLGFATFFGLMFVLNRIFAKKLTGLIDTVQAILQQSQNEANRMAQRFMNKPVGSQKVMQRQLEKVVAKGVDEALEVLEKAQPLYKWTLLAERQINTVKFQLNYQVKRFDECDRLMPHMFVTDALTVAMKLARQYRTDAPELEKTFRKGVRKFKYDKGTLLYAAYSWMLVKRKQYDQALEVLAEGKEKTEDETIARNWEAIANNKAGRFSNSGIGEQWYALHLGEPPKARAGKGQLKGHPLAPKGRRRYF